VAKHEKIFVKNII